MLSQSVSSCVGQSKHKAAHYMTFFFFFFFFFSLIAMCVHKPCTMPWCVLPRHKYLASMPRPDLLLHSGQRNSFTQQHGRSPVPHIGSGDCTVPRKALGLIPTVVQEVHQGQQHVHCCAAFFGRCAKRPGVYNLHHIPQCHQTI